MKYSIKYCLQITLTIIATLSPSMAFSRTVEATIIDATSHQPLPYATIFNSCNKQGTICNTDGFFSLNNVNKGDIILISNIGYESLQLPISELLLSDSICMFEKAKRLQEVMVFANNNYFYKLLSNCRKKALEEMKYAYKSYKTAKCYFELKTYVDTQQVELIESYYNGNISKYNLSSLDFKNGRLALNTVNGRYFLSTSTSNTFYKHNLFTKCSLFPGNPMELNLRWLHKIYHLNLIKTYLENDKSTWYKIEFSPKNGYKQTFFNGTIWIDSASQHIAKITLAITDAKKHPFMALMSNQELDKCNMEITKKFEEHDGSMYVQSIDFKYDHEYRQVMPFGDDSIFTSTTSSVIYAYDYKHQFINPMFRFYNGHFKDYTQISAATYNNFFWQNMTEFTLNDTKNKSDQFIKDNKEIDRLIDTFDSSLDNGNRFGKGYLIWSNDRLHLPSEAEDSAMLGTLQSNINSIHYQLSPKIYLDITKLNDSVQVLSKSMLDLNESFFKFPATPKSIVFLNIYFDLIEVNRRDLNRRIVGLSAEEILIEYKATEREIDKITKKYIYQTSGGADLRFMKIWNSYIVEKLGIDNLKIFKIEI